MGVKVLLLLDGSYLIYKSYYRARKIKDGTGVSSEEHFQKIARNMFLKIVSSIKNKYNPVFMFFVFDGEGENFRHSLLPTYKSNRKEKPEDLLGVKTEIYQFLQLHNFPFQLSQGVEADDLMASFVKQHPNEKIQIFTGDADLGALVNPNVSLLLEKKKKVYHITVENFHHFFPVPPNKFSDFKALQGDKSDFVKGVDGLFKTQVLHLLMEYSSVEEYFEKGKEHYLFNKISQDKDKILVNKSVTKMLDNCEITYEKENMNVNRIYIPEKIASKINWK